MSFWQGIFLIMMRMTGWVMMLAPIGVFALIAKVVADVGLRRRGTAAAVRRLRGRRAAAVRLRRAADAAGHRGARESVAALSGHGAGTAHRVLDRVFIGDAAAVAAVPGEARQGVRAHRRFRDAARRLDESRRQRVVRMRRRHVHRAGIWTAPVVRHAVHRRDPGADHVDGHGGNSRRVARGHRGHPCGGGIARRSHRRAAGVRSPARHVPHGHQRAGRRGLHGDRRAPGR